MKIGTPKETFAGEARVAMTPDSARQLQKLGHECLIESGAGLAAGFTDAAYEEAGVELVKTAANLWKNADIVAKKWCKRPSNFFSHLMNRHCLSSRSPADRCLAGIVQPPVGDAVGRNVGSRSQGCRDGWATETKACAITDRRRAGDWRSNAVLERDRQHFCVWPVSGWV